MKKILIALMILFSAQTAKAAEIPQILADSAILIEASSGRVIFEKNADEVRPPASMTKMMTCILGIEWLPLDTQITVSASAAATEYSDLQLQTGEVISADDLMQGTMLVSDNCGAVAIAQAVAGNVPAFAEMMNEKARELGCYNTNFENPHGLTSQNHYSTARDMAKIAAYCMRNETFRRYVGTRRGNVHLTQPDYTFEASNTNQLLESYPGCIGIKTGYTNAAGGCLAACANQNGVELIAIVMHSPDYDTRFSDAAKLLDYGFEVIDSVENVEVGEVRQVVFVRGGTSGKVHVESQENFNFPILSGEDKNLLSLSFDLPKFIDAEILRGDKIGEVILNYDGKQVANLPLVATEDVAQGFSFGSLLVELSRSFKNPTQDFLLKLVA